MRGYSLIELLSTIALFSILTTTAISQGKSWRDRQALNLEGEKLEIVLKTLLLTSQSRREPITLQLTRSTYHAFSKEEPGLILERHSLRSGVAIELEDEQEQISLYNSNTTSPRTVTLSNGEERCKIIISLRGRITNGC